MLLLLTLVCSFLFSCGEYKDPLKDPSGNQGPIRPSLDDDPTNDFTVTLMKDGEVFVPDTAIDVYWSDGYDTFVAPVVDGVARIDGLDGDYNVVLSATPSGFSYNPNGNKVTNLNKHIQIHFYDISGAKDKLTPATPSGNIKDDGDLIRSSLNRISETGVYTIKISKPGERYYFEYSPQTNGVYTIESWVSIVDDEVNPLAYSITGTAQGGFWGEYPVTDYGEVGSYTHNYIHTVEIADENISSGGGSLSFYFALGAESKSEIYPITYSFAIKKNGGFSNDRESEVMISADADWSHFDFDAFNALAGSEIAYAETPVKDKNGNDVPGAYVFDQRYYKLWAIEDGGDGVYHVYDEEKYASTGGYGPVLFAYITESTRVTSAFTTMEAAGNSALTVNVVENHKQFIEGWSGMLSSDKNYYCEADCPCRTEAESKGEVHHACPPSCTKCKCRKCPEEMLGAEGYADWCNSDGVVPVTEELKHFLQSFAISRNYYMDGYGYAESKLPVQPYEDSQWLFACGYYVNG